MDTIKRFDVTPFNYTVQNAGNYHVRLIVKNSVNCSADLTKYNYIIASPPPVADFTENIEVDCDSFTNVIFTNTSQNCKNPVTYLWDFGDGSTGMGLSLQHLFAETGTYTVCATAYNDCGADSSCITFNALGPVGVKDINGFEEISVYPNPARESLTIGNAEAGTRLAVFNAVGQQMQSTVLYTSPAQIDVSGLPPGVYLLQVSDGEEKVGYGRFVKN